MLNKRPEKGTVTTKTIHISVCRNCGYAVDEIGCEWKCIFDTTPRTNFNTFTAVYERVETFVGDEDYDPEN